MTGTEELRQLLDEHGIPWEADETEMWFDDEEEPHTVEFTRWKDSNGSTVLMAFWQGTDLLWEFGWEPTPKQAVEATLAQETCKMESSWRGMTVVNEYHCTACDEYADVEVIESVGTQPPAFCPNCGRKVER